MEQKWTCQIKNVLLTNDFFLSHVAHSGDGDSASAISVRIDRYSDETCCPKFSQDISNTRWTSNLNCSIMSLTGLNNCLLIKGEEILNDPSEDRGIHQVLDMCFVCVLL